MFGVIHWHEMNERVKKAILTDETWVNVCQATFKGKEKTIQTPKDACLALLTIGLKDPTQQGPRFYYCTRR